MKLRISAYFGTIFSALLASSCCWLPLALVFFGISGTAASSFLSAYRIPFLIFTFSILGVAFYLHYRKPKDQNSCCEVPKRKFWTLRKFNAISLWTTTLLVIALAFLPYYAHIFQKNSSQCDTELLNKIESIEKDAANKSACCP